MAQRVTLKDIAQALGLSIPTVSRALADHPDISADTKARVREAAHALHYVPNYRARDLRTRHSRLVALILPQMNMFFIPSLITGINRVLQRNDYSLIVFQSDNSYGQERRLVEYCSHLATDGVLLALSSETTNLEHLEILRDCEIPVVLLDNTIDTTKHSTVTIDDIAAGREAAHYLIDHGHTTAIGVFGDQRQRISSLRLRGFRQGHIDRDVPLDENRIVAVAALDTFDEQLSRALDDSPGTTAIFTMSDELMVQTHHVLMQRGVRIPEDVSLMAISDGLATAFLYPQISHIRHSGAEVGERTAHILIGLIDHQSEAMVEVKIRTTLVEAKSVVTRIAG